MRAAPSIFSFCAPRTLCAQDVADLQSGLATSHQPIHTRYRILLIPYRFVFALLRRYQVQRSNVSRGSPCITVRLNEQPAHRISSPMPRQNQRSPSRLLQVDHFRSLEQGYAVTEQHAVPQVSRLNCCRTCSCLSRRHVPRVTAIIVNHALSVFVL